MTPKAKLLVAEDNKVNQMVITAMLKKHGFDFDVVANGKEVLDALHRGGYDLVLMDVQMPVMDGLAATEEIRKQSSVFSQIPIIAITANALGGDRERYLAAGMNDYIAKPIDLRELLATINRYIKA